MCVFATNWKDIVIEIKRNRRTFGNVERSSAELLKILEEEVRNIMLSITVKQSYVVQQAEEQWKVKFMKQQ
ncbi:hypothetical protein Tco_0882131 [Tanacetum coccineum]